MKVDPSDLVGVTEIAKRCNVRLSAVSNWTVRHEDFPKPVVELSFGKLWVWPQVQRWLTATGRNAK